MAVRRKHISLIVKQMLTTHRITAPPVPVETLALALGAEVRQEPAEDDLSGFIYRDRKRRSAVIGVNSLHHSNRQRFTVAHELGHFLLHEGDALHVDRRFLVNLRDTKSSEGTDLEEKEANLFAAELLMPRQFLERDVAEIGVVDLEEEDVIRELAEKYEVSTQAMTFRLNYLGYVQL